MSKLEINKNYMNSMTNEFCETFFVFEHEYKNIFFLISLLRHKDALNATSGFSYFNMGFQFAVLHIYLCCIHIY